MATCPSCQAKVTAGNMFCEDCGASVSTVQVARRLRQQSFDTVTDNQTGLLAPGERLKYRWRTYIVEEAIARSGFGATFRATKIRDKQQVLIKQMLDQSSYDQFKDQLMKSFKREAKFIRKIKHPAFPRGHDYFEKNGSFFLVMDFINGKELAKAIEDYRKRNGSIPDGLLIFLGIEIAEALEIIHRAGYLYRDLKPQNVMLDGISGRVKLIDFGTLFKRTDENPLLFESEGYTPPEFMDSKEKFSEAGDIYSLGALLYEAATEHTPSAPGNTDLLDRSGRDARFISIVKKCLALDPKDRFSSASSVSKALRGLTRKKIWPFRKGKAIQPVELSVLPKTLYPSACTFCEFCGFADPHSQIGYCEKCRTPLRVGRLTWKENSKEKEFFLYADETTIGNSKQSHLPLTDPKAQKLLPKHVRIFRRKNGLYLEAIEPEKNFLTRLNRRKVVGPVELLDGDMIELDELLFVFTLKDAC